MKRQAMTLIELLVIMVIVGILAMVAIPNFSGVRGAALHSHARNSIAHIAHAAKIWNAEHGTVLAPFPAVADGQFEDTLGTNVTGIGLSGIDSDTVWNYTLSGNVITATFGASGACVQGRSFTYDLTNNSFSDFKCK